jgi:hypothetical protein
LISLFGPGVRLCLWTRAFSFSQNNPPRKIEMSTDWISRADDDTESTLGLSFAASIS